MISLSKFVRKYNVDYKSSDKFEGCVISKDGKVIHEIKLTNGLYPMPSPLKQKTAT